MKIKKKAENNFNFDNLEEIDNIVQKNDENKKKEEEDKSLKEIEVVPKKDENINKINVKDNNVFKTEGHF